MDEDEDSRTSTVGRKRDHGAMEVSNEHEPEALFSGDDSRSHKRVNRSILPTDVVAIDNVSLISLESSHTNIPYAEDQSLAEAPGQQMEQGLSRPIWNKSAQTGVVRTSFGGRQKNLPKHLEIEAMREYSMIGQLEGVSSLSPPILDRQPGRATDTSSHNQHKLGIDVLVDDSNAQSKTDRMVLEPQPSSHGAKKAASFESNTTNANPPPVTDSLPQKGLGKPTKLAKKSLGAQSPLNGAPIQHKCGGGTLIIPEMFVNEKSVEIENLRFEDFLDHLTKVNSIVKFSKLKPQHLRVAFSKYIDGYYPPPLFSEAQKAAANQTAAAAIPGMPKLVANAVDKLKNGAKTMVLRSQNAALQQTEKLCNVPASDSQLFQNQQALQQNVDIEIGHGDSYTPNQVQAIHSTFTTPSAPPALEKHDRQLLSKDIVIGDSPCLSEEARVRDPFQEISEIESALLGRYFPAVDGVPAKPRCLACADITHSTIDCPALSCTVCGGNHTTFQCRMYQLCVRCRQRGHSTSDCAEKLLPSKDELVCDICGSSSHLEMHCQLIWRSFASKPEEMKPRLSVPVYCYYCGDKGHYGGECGLNKQSTSSGGETWSRSTRMIVAPTTNAPRKDFSIRGKAHDPIDLDGSDGDLEFIRSKVSNPPVSRRRDYGPGSGGQLSFDNNARSAPPLPESYDRIDNFRAPPTRPMQPNPGFAFGEGANTARRKLSVLGKSLFYQGQK